MLELVNTAVKLGHRQFVFDLKVTPGERVAVVGASGSGKSTLLSLIGGFLKCDSGDILWNNESLLDMTPDQRPVTTLFQKDNLFEHLSVEENVLFGLQPSFRPTEQDREKVRDSLSHVGLKGMGNVSPMRMSGGEQQRVALARSFLRKKPVLLLDEPYSSLDEGTRADMLGLTDQIVRLNELTVIMVTHQMTDAVTLDARVVSIINDKIIA